MLYLFMQENYPLDIAARAAAFYICYNALPLYFTSLAPLACADNLLLTVTRISLAPDALASQISVTRSSL
jgi:hypothetical protein